MAIQVNVRLQQASAAIQEAQTTFDTSYSEERTSQLEHILRLLGNLNTSIPLDDSEALRVYDALFTSYDELHTRTMTAAFKGLPIDDLSDLEIDDEEEEVLDGWRQLRVAVSADLDSADLDSADLDPNYLDTPSPLGNPPIPTDLSLSPVTPIAKTAEDLLKEIFENLENPVLHDEEDARAIFASAGLISALEQLESVYPQTAQALYLKMPKEDFMKKENLETAQWHLAQLIEGDNLSNLPFTVSLY